MFFRKKKQPDYKGAAYKEANFILPNMIAGRCPHIGAPGHYDGWLVNVMNDSEGTRHVGTVMLGHLMDYFPDVEALVVTHANSQPMVTATSLAFSSAKKRMYNHEVRIGADHAGHAISGEFRPGTKAVILQCVTVSGQTAVAAANIVRAHAGEVLGVASLLDMERGAAETIGAADLPFRPVYLPNTINGWRSVRGDPGDPTVSSNPKLG